jgi:hypothetical protein
VDWPLETPPLVEEEPPDGRPHGRLRLDLGRDYVPPKPQAGLFDALDYGDDADDAEEDSDPG